MTTLSRGWCWETAVVDRPRSDPIAPSANKPADIAHNSCAFMSFNLGKLQRRRLVDGSTLNKRRSEPTIRNLGGKVTSGNTTLMGNSIRAKATKSTI